MEEQQMKEIKTVKNLMNDEELMSYVTEDLEDFEEDMPVTYEVWAIGYDANDKITDAELFLGEFTDPDKAIEKAKSLTFSDVIQLAADEDCTIPDEPVAYLSIEVETVVEDTEDEDGGTVNLGSVYQRELWIDGEYGSEEDVNPFISLSDGEYKILEDNTVKVRCELLKDFNKNDLVRLYFPDAPGIDCQIVSKVIYEDGDYYHCEMMF
jgi:hypothetical protein